MLSVCLDMHAEDAHCSCTLYTPPNLRPYSVGIHCRRLSLAYKLLFITKAQRGELCVIATPIILVADISLASI